MGSRWLIYALGGGLGHLQRGMSLARAAAKHGISSTILTNSPWAPRVLPQAQAWLSVASQSDVEVQCLSPKVTPEESRDNVQRCLCLENTQVLVVDTFPRGLGGELADTLSDFEGHKVWVHRDISPMYLEQFEIRDRWAPHYDCILAPGERGELADLAVDTLPWLLLSPAEILSRESARSAWDISCGDGAPNVLVVSCGKDSEAAMFLTIANQLRQARPDVHVRVASIGHDPLQWPLLASLKAADLIVGAGGYNTVHEANALGIPLIGVPQPRMYDRQAKRLEELAFRMVAPGPELNQRVVLAVEEGLACCAESSAAVRPLANGADMAAQHIAATVV